MTGHLDTGFSLFPCVYKRMLRWFPSFQVATTCFSCSPPDLNFLVFLNICVHVKNHCHQVTTQLQLINIIIMSTVGVHKSRKQGRRSDTLLYTGASWLWVFSMEIYVTILAPRILRWFLHFWKIC